MSTEHVISKEECILLNEVLGTKTPSGCYNFSRTDFEDSFTVPGDKVFSGRDEEKHRECILFYSINRSWCT